MIERKRKQLIKAIFIKSIAVALLIFANFIVIEMTLPKLSEKSIYNAVEFEYPNLEFDKELSRIAEECAEKCYNEKIEAKDVRILENENFVKHFSSECHVTKYTASANTDDEFINNFSSAMAAESYSDTHNRLKECQFVGIGKYKTQIFILAFYID